MNSMVYRLQGKSLAWLIEVVVFCVLHRGAGLLFANTSNGLPHSAPGCP